MAISVGDLVAYLRLDDKMSEGLAKAGDSVQKFGSAMLPLSAGFAVVGGAAIKFATDLNASMANVATLIPNSTDRVVELREEVQRISEVTGKSSKDIAEGLYQVISAYSDSADSAKLLEINARAGAAGLATTLDAINLTSAVTKGYGDVSVAATEKAADLAFVTVKLGQTTFPELAGSIGAVIPIAASLGVKQEELFAGFATLTGVTGNAAEVTTQLKGAMTDMIAPNDAMAAGLAKAGIESASVAIKQDGLVATIRKLTATTDGSTESIQAMFNNIRGLPAVLALTGGQAETFDQKLGEMGKTAGAMTEAFKEQTEGVNASGFAFAVLKEKMVGALENLGLALMPTVVKFTEGALIPLVHAIEQAVKWFESLSPEMKLLVAGFGAAVAALAPLSFALAATLKIMGALVPLVTSAATPWVLLGVAIAGFGVAVYVVTNRLIDMVPGLRSVTTALGDFALKVFGVQSALDLYNKAQEKGKDATAGWTDEQKKSHAAFLKTQAAAKDSVSLFDGLAQSQTKVTAATTASGAATTAAGAATTKATAITTASILAKVHEAEANKTLAEATEIMGRPINDLATALNVVRIAHENSPAAIEKHKAELEKADKAWRKWTKTLYEAEVANKSATDEMMDSITSNTIAKMMKEREERIEAAADAYTGMVNSQIAADQLAGKSIQEQVNFILNKEDQQRKANKTSYDAIMAMENLTEAEKKAAIAALNLGDSAKKMNEPLLVSAYIASELGNIIGGTLGEALSGAGDALGDYANQMEAAGKIADETGQEMAEIAAKAGLLSAGLSILGNTLQKSTNPTLAKLGGAASGAAKGLKLGVQAGMMFGPMGAVVGGAIGAVGGAIFGFLGKAKKMRAEMDKLKGKLVEQYGSLSAAGAAAKKYGIDLQKAMDSKSPAKLAAAMEELAKKTEATAQKAEIFTAGLDRMKKGIDEFAGKIQGAGEAQGRIFTAAFWGVVGEEGIVAAVDAFREPFEAMRELFPEIMAPLGELFDKLEEGTPLRSAAEGVTGLNDVMMGMAATQMLNIDLFNDFQAAGKAAYDEMIAGGATAGEALQLMMPFLANQVELSKKYGYELDANTQALVRQAEEAGYAFPTDPMLAMLDVLVEIAKVLGADIPEAARRSGAAISGIPKPPNPNDYAPGPGSPREEPMESHAKGTSFVTHTGPAYLHQGEQVIPHGGGRDSEAANEIRALSATMARLVDPYRITKAMRDGMAKAR